MCKNEYPPSNKNTAKLSASFGFRSLRSLLPDPEPIGRYGRARRGEDSSFDGSKELRRMSDNLAVSEESTGARPLRYVTSREAATTDRLTRARALEKDDDHEMDQDPDNLPRQQSDPLQAISPVGPVSTEGGPEPNLTFRGPTQTAGTYSESAPDAEHNHYASEPAKQGLTHVNRKGEAHMVDVGAKSDTKRIAVAFASVYLKAGESYRLIKQDAHKKGDVLAVARIAAIMAAKRTSDLIPLCHPIAITSTKVDVELVAPEVHGPAWRWNKKGIVTIQVQVECTGPTGVEMEALTAASTGALTVYDMCKAVDRDMEISTRVVYKDGGRSGLWYDPKWALHAGETFFEQRKLRLPPNDLARLRATRRDIDDEKTSERSSYVEKSIM